jgi:type I restriction enzyme M protein
MVKVRRETRETAPMPLPGMKASQQMATQQSLNSAIWSVCDILRSANLAGALQYVPELTWLLFLRILDEREEEEQDEAEAVGRAFTPSLAYPYRWRDWAAPTGPKRRELQAGKLGEMFAFVNGDLLPYLRLLGEESGATPRQRVISQIVSGVRETRVDTERNLLDVLDKLDAISNEAIDTTHIFALSQVYEGLLLKMGEKNNDGGQFFTPREVIRAVVRALDPRLGETVYDPGCGTGGFLAETYGYLLNRPDADYSADDMETLKRRTFYGRDKDDIAFSIALANLVLHGIDEPHIWHGNTLTGQVSYAGLYKGAPERFDLVMTNPPFGGKEGKEAQTLFPFQTSATQVLFLQHVMNSLKDGGRCGIVLDEGVLFRTNETAFVQTKRRLLEECDLWCIVSLPPGVFTAAGAGVKTNLLFFTRGSHTEKVWYYDLSDVKVGKKTPLTLDRFNDFLTLLPTRGDSDRSWSVTREEIAAKHYDLKAVNPNAKNDGDTRPPAELLDLIEAKGREVADALAALRQLTRG